MNRAPTLSSPCGERRQRMTEPVIPTYEGEAFEGGTAAKQKVGACGPRARG